MMQRATLVVSKKKNMMLNNHLVKSHAKVQGRAAAAGAATTRSLSMNSRNSFSHRYPLSATTTSSFQSLLARTTSRTTPATTPHKAFFVSCVNNGFLRAQQQQQQLLFGDQRAGGGGCLVRRCFSSMAAPDDINTTSSSNLKKDDDEDSSSAAAASMLLFHDYWKTQVSNENTALQYDKNQERAVKKLQRLQLALQGYDNAPFIEYYYEKRRLAAARRQAEKEAAEAEISRNAQQEQSSPTPEKGDDTLERVSVSLSENEKEIEQQQPPPPEPDPPRVRVPRGFYLYGSVGTGKSMLMDSFFELLGSSVHKKRRCHFHAFMAEVHERIHKLKQDDLSKYGRNFHVDTDEYRNPIHRVGRQIAEETAVLCFDEFQVTDVADALILSQLFSVLFTLGTVVVATSNRPPQDLYEGGLNRYYFLPFIDLLQKHCVTHDMASHTDYRKITSANYESYYFCGTQQDGTTVAQQLDDLVAEMRQGIPLADGAANVTELLLGHQRKLLLNDADDRGKVVRVSFDELCNRELGATDYRRLAYQFQTVILEDIPLLNMEEHDRARRFITLVDELYEGRCALVCVARDATATDPSLLFPNSKRQSDGDSNYDDNDDDAKEDMLGWMDQATSKGGHPVGALASVRELDFAFERAASRLTEMTSLNWWDRVLRTHA